SSSNFSGPAGFTYSLSGLGGTGGTFAPNTSTGNLAGSPVASGSYQLSVFGQGASVAGPYSIDWLLQVDVATIGGVLPPPPPPGGITEISPVTEETAVTNVVPAAVIVQTGGEAATVIAQRFSSFVSKAIGGGRRGSPAGVPAVYVPGGGVPLAAGDVLQSPMGYWASYSRNNLRNNFSTTAFDGNVTNVIGGVDWTFGEDLLVGLAAGYEKQDFVTLFNGGTQQTDGIVVAPYAGWRINDQWSIDGTAGFAYNDVEQSRTQLAQTITSELDAWRVFAAGNVNWFGGRDRWLLSARAGVLYAQDSFDSFTENTGVAGGLFNPEREFDIGQASIGGEIGYAIGDFVPFVNGRFVYDVEESVVEVGPGQVSPGSDRTEFQAGFGLRYYSDNGISADVEFSTVETRSNIDSYTISATVRIDL
ncbi:MAG: autotransporter outer membrane beta-barrel domain-containing protein, partial [Gammaproteobacteria bacterium]|nr:autotransporter outer membrane beta-barrel domain-containing protein [Gammaproteobacteria bacterium]